MDFVDDIDLVFAFDGGVTYFVDEVADLLDAIVARGVDFDDVRVGTRIHREAVGAAVALMADAFFTVQCLCKEPRHGSFARSSGPAEKICMSNLVIFNRVPHRADDGTLARHFFESGRAVFVIERFVCH